MTAATDRVADDGEHGTAAEQVAYGFPAPLWRGLERLRPPGPLFKASLWRSPLRGQWLTSVFAVVLLVGLPVGLLAGWGPHAVVDVVMVPCRLGTRWVATVAEVAARLEPRGPWVLVGWGVMLGGVAALLRPGRATAADPTKEPAAVSTTGEAAPQPSIASSDSTEGAK